MKAAFFDLDKTLLDVNSATLWVRHEWDAGRLSVRDVAWAGWYIAQYSLGRDALEHAFSDAVASLAGQEEALLEARTRRWFEDRIAHRLRPGAREAVERHRAAGDRLVVATSSSRYAGEAAVRAFGLDDLVCSLFEVRDGLFTGKVEASCYGAAKADRVAEWAERNGVDLGRSAFYTDSATDAALLERVGEPVAVNPDRRLLRLASSRGWKVVDWGRAA